MTETYVTYTCLFRRIAYTTGKMTVLNFTRRRILSEEKQLHEQNSAL
jgi:hypothetical protein